MSVEYVAIDTELWTFSKRIAPFPRTCVHMDAYLVLSPYHPGIVVLFGDTGVQLADDCGSEFHSQPLFQLPLTRIVSH